MTYLAFVDLSTAFGNGVVEDKEKWRMSYNQTFYIGEVL